MNRRTVLRHAVKLAYATPLIVATVPLDAGPVQAISEQFCGDPCYILQDALGCCELKQNCPPTTGVGSNPICS